MREGVCASLADMQIGRWNRNPNLGIDDVIPRSTPRATKRAQSKDWRRNLLSRRDLDREWRGSNPCAHSEAQAFASENRISGVLNGVCVYVCVCVLWSDCGCVAHASQGYVLEALSESGPRCNSSGASGGLAISTPSHGTMSALATLQRSPN